MIFADFGPNLYAITHGLYLDIDTQSLDENFSVEGLVSPHVPFNYAFRTQVTLNIFTLHSFVNISDVLLKLMLQNFFSTEVTHYFRYCYVLCFATISSMFGKVLNRERHPAILALFPLFEMNSFPMQL